MLHSEIGMPNVVMDSLKANDAQAGDVARGDVWGMHDFTITGARRAAAWRDMIEKTTAAPRAQPMELSQFIDYDGYRAMFEAQGKNRMGVLLWMSHPVGRPSCGRLTITTSTKQRISAARRAPSRCT